MPSIFSIPLIYMITFPTFIPNICTQQQAPGNISVNIYIVCVGDETILRIEMYKRQYLYSVAKNHKFRIKWAFPYVLRIPNHL